MGSFFYNISHFLSGFWVASQYFERSTLVRKREKKKEIGFGATGTGQDDIPNNNLRNDRYSFEMPKYL